MAPTPPPKRPLPARIAAAVVLASPFALVGVGVGLVLGVGWGLAAAGALIYHDTREPSAPRDGKP